VVRSPEGAPYLCAVPRQVFSKQPTGWVANNGMLVLAREIKTVPGRLFFGTGDLLPVLAESEEEYTVRLRQEGVAVTLAVPRTQADFVRREPVQVAERLPSTGVEEASAAPVAVAVERPPPAKVSTGMTVVASGRDMVISGPGIATEVLPTSPSGTPFWQDWKWPEITWPQSWKNSSWPVSWTQSWTENAYVPGLLALLAVLLVIEGVALVGKRVRRRRKQKAHQRMTMGVRDFSRTMPTRGSAPPRKTIPLKAEPREAVAAAPPPDQADSEAEVASALDSAKTADGDLQGALENFSIGQVVQFFHVNSESGTLTLSARNGSGPDTLLFVDGRIVDGRSGHENGTEAVLQVLRRRKGNFAFTRGAINPDVQRIKADTMSLLLEAHQLVDEAGWID